MSKTVYVVTVNERDMDAYDLGVSSWVIGVFTTEALALSAGEQELIACVKHYLDAWPSYDDDDMLSEVDVNQAIADAKANGYDDTTLYEFVHSSFWIHVKEMPLL